MTFFKKKWALNMRPTPGYMRHKVQFRRGFLLRHSGNKEASFPPPFSSSISCDFWRWEEREREIGTVVSLFIQPFSLFFLVPSCGKWDSDLFPICALLRYTEEDQINAEERVLQEREILFPHAPPHLDPI